MRGVKIFIGVQIMNSHVEIMEINSVKKKVSIRKKIHMDKRIPNNKKCSKAGLGQLGIFVVLTATVEPS